MGGDDERSPRSYVALLGGSVKIEDEADGEPGDDPAKSREDSDFGVFGFGVGEMFETDGIGETERRHEAKGVGEEEINEDCCVIGIGVLRCESDEDPGEAEQ